MFRRFRKEPLPKKQKCYTIVYEDEEKRIIDMEEICDLNDYFKQCIDARGIEKLEYYCYNPEKKLILIRYKSKKAIEGIKNELPTNNQGTI